MFDATYKGERVIVRGLLGLSLAGALLMGCAQPGQDGDATRDVEGMQQALTQRYDGATLIRGVFFGRGPVAAALPEIWGKRPFSAEDAASAFETGMSELEHDRETSALDEKIADIIRHKKPKSEQVADDLAKRTIEKLTAQDKSFLEAFEKGIYSGDPVIVSDTIEDLAKRLGPLMESDALENPSRYGTEYVINEDSVVNVNTFMNINVSYAIDMDHTFALNTTKLDGLDKEAALHNQVVIARITDRFAAMGAGKLAR